LRRATLCRINPEMTEGHSLDMIDLLESYGTNQQIDNFILSGIFGEILFSVNIAYSLQESRAVGSSEYHVVKI
jgi:hypothetical protein